MPETSRARLRHVTCYLIMTLYSTDPTAVNTHVCHSLSLSIVVSTFDPSG